MSADLLIRAPVGLLPVLIFLVTLVYLDSYKLVRFRVVVWVIVGGGGVAVASYFANGVVHDLLQIDLRLYTRYVSPVIEESLKALVMVFLFRTSRIGFLVDSAIMGFAVGAGFAVIENIFYLYAAAGANTGVWVVRGFGTAIMHGGVAAIFGIMSQTLTERSMKVNPVYYLPGLGAATALHSFFNHFPVDPILLTAGILAVLPAVLYLVFRRSARAMHEWLQLDFDSDAALIEQINSGQFTETKVGRFLDDLRDKFEGPVLVDMLCYLRIYTELAMRAKGVLMMRENGLEVPVGERTREKFAEMEYLEKSIGKTGLLAMRPFLLYNRKDLFQLNVLES